MKIYFATAGGFGGTQVGYFFKKERAKAELYKIHPRARDLADQWQWDPIRNGHVLRLNAEDVTLVIREYQIQ